MESSKTQHGAEAHRGPDVCRQLADVCRLRAVHLRLHRLKNTTWREAGFPRSSVKTLQGRNMLTPPNPRKTLESTWESTGSPHHEPLEPLRRLGRNRRGRERGREKEMERGREERSSNCEVHFVNRHRVSACIQYCRSSSNAEAEISRRLAFAHCGSCPDHSADSIALASSFIVAFIFVVHAFSKPGRAWLGIILRLSWFYVYAVSCKHCTSFVAERHWTSSGTLFLVLQYVKPRPQSCSRLGTASIHCRKPRTPAAGQGKVTWPCPGYPGSGTQRNRANHLVSHSKVNSPG